MLDTTPIEWLFSNFSRLNSPDQQQAMRPILYYILLPSVSSYLFAAFTTMRFVKTSASLSQKVLARLVIPLTCSAVVTDSSYYINHSKFVAVHEELAIKYPLANG